MGTPAKTTILAAVDTALSGILGAGAGYKSTVVTVEPQIRDASGVPVAERPYLGFMPRRERFVPFSMQIYRVTMPLYVAGHVQASTKALVVAAIINLQDDVIAALCASTGGAAECTLGGECIELRLVDGDDDIGDPDTEMGAGESGYSGTFDQNWEIVYERAMGAS